MTSAAPIVGILAGGHSRRMGSDKAALPWRGTSLLGHVCAAALDAGLSTVVVGRVRHAGLPPSVALIPDERPDEGPLGGLVTLLRTGPPAVILLSCDLPCIDAAAIRWLVDMATSEPAPHGFIPLIGGRLHPCSGLYRPRVLPLAVQRLEAGHRSLRGLIVAGAFAIHACPADLADRFADVDTPQEWRTFATR